MKGYAKMLDQGRWPFHAGLGLVTVAASLGLGMIGSTDTITLALPRSNAG